MHAYHAVFSYKWNGGAISGHNTEPFLPNKNNAILQRTLASFARWQLIKKNRLHIFGLTCKKQMHSNAAEIKKTNRAKPKARITEELCSQATKFKIEKKNTFAHILFSSVWSSVWMSVSGKTYHTGARPINSDSSRRVWLLFRYIWSIWPLKIFDGFGW